MDPLEDFSKAVGGATRGNGPESPGRPPSTPPPRAPNALRLGAMAAASPLQEPDGDADVAAFQVPATFEGWCSFASEVLSPAEELAPLKLGAIKAVISDMNKDVGLFVAPAFVVGQVLFLLAFVGYLVTAIVALIFDSGAASDECARASWVWLFVLLAVALPLVLGLVMALVKTSLMLSKIKVPTALFSATGPGCYVCLFVLGVLLWARMSPDCDVVYSRDYVLLYLVFKVQVFVLGVAAIVGAITTWAETVALFAEFERPEPRLPELTKNLDGGIRSSVTARKKFVDESETVISRLKQQLEKTQRERDELEKQRDAARKSRGEDFELPQTFGEFSSVVVKHLAPVEELSLFKLGQIQEIIVTINKDVGDALAPTFAVAIVFFLLACIAYVTLAIVALGLDRGALWDSCAEDYWIWLYVLLVLAIPTALGLVMGIVKTALNAANLKQTVGVEIPAVLLALPGPALYIVLGVLGIVIWATMDDECVDWYEDNAMFLLTIFRIQVILIGVAAIIGLLTVLAQAVVLITQLSMGKDDTGSAAQHAGGGEGISQSGPAAEEQGFQMPRMPKIELPEMPKIEVPKIAIPQMPTVDVGFTFEDFSALVVENLSPLEQVLASSKT
jgi:hypothetical protein